MLLQILFYEPTLMTSWGPNAAHIHSMRILKADFYKVRIKGSRTLTIINYMLSLVSYHVLSLCGLGPCSSKASRDSKHQHFSSWFAFSNKRPGVYLTPFSSSWSYVSDMPRRAVIHTLQVHCRTVVVLSQSLRLTPPRPFYFRVPIIRKHGPLCLCWM